MKLKIKDKNCILDNLKRENFNYRGLLVDKNLDPVFSRIRIRIRVTQKDWIRSDPAVNPPFPKKVRGKAYCFKSF